MSPVLFPLVGPNETPSTNLNFALPKHPDTLSQCVKQQTGPAIAETWAFQKVCLQFIVVMCNSRQGYTLAFYHNSIADLSLYLVSRNKLTVRRGGSAYIITT